MNLFIRTINKMSYMLNYRNNVTRNYFWGFIDNKCNWRTVSLLYRRSFFKRGRKIQ